MGPDSKPKKVAIVGFTASKSKAPWDDPSFEIWICNNLWKFCPPNWHRLYDLHETSSIREDTEHDGFLRGAAQKTAEGKEIALGKRDAWVFEPQKEWPTAKLFPRDVITDKLGNYFTNSISWMIAHALMQGTQELHVYGVDMATGSEYSSQRPSCEYLLGIAVGMGVKVHVPLESDLLKTTGLYGTGADNALAAKIQERETELAQRARQVDQQLDQLQTARAQLQGALETTRYFGTVWTHPRATQRHEQGQNGSVDNAETIKELIAA